MKDEVYIVASSRTWHDRIYTRVIQHFPGTWHYVTSVDELTLAYLQRLKPRYVFFLHWSHKLPLDIVNSFECVVFHMTDLPYGRGGSPLQNLLINGHRQTKLTALRMVEKFDAGPIYFKEDLSLEGSTAEEIYVRAGLLSAQMIESIIRDHPQPVAQSGVPTLFRRRKPEESAIPVLQDLQKLHDFIRMLDAEGYPKAFIEHEGFRYEFRRAAIYDGRIEADVTITPMEKPEE